MKTLEENLDALVLQLTEEVRPFVKRTESSLPTTKDHYGDYLGFLTSVGTETRIKIVAVALIHAGANKIGVASALRLLGIIT